jgi:hypothetical protein
LCKKYFGIGRGTSGRGRGGGACALRETGLASFDEGFDWGIVVDRMALGFVNELFGAGVHNYLKLIMV